MPWENTSFSTHRDPTDSDRLFSSTEASDASSSTPESFPNSPTQTLAEELQATECTLIQEDFEALHISSPGSTPLDVTPQQYTPQDCLSQSSTRTAERMFSSATPGTAVPPPRFAGHRDGRPRKYVDNCVTFVMMQFSKDATNSSDTQAVKLLSYIFHAGLSGEAKQWCTDFEDRDDDISWPDLEEAFLKQFEQKDSAREMMLVGEAYQFARIKSEELKTFVRRAETLYNKLPSDSRQVLLTNMVMHLADGDRDATLQTRLVDRLGAAGKFRGRCAAKTLTMMEIKEQLTECLITGRNPISWKDDDADIGDNATLKDVTRQLGDLSKNLGMMVNHLSSNQTRSSGYGNYGTNQNSTWNQRGNGGSGSYRPSDRQPTDEDPQMMWCFGCGTWGHKAYSCPNKGRIDSAQFEANRDRWIADSRRMKEERAREIAQSQNAATNVVTFACSHDNLRPPARYRLKTEGTTERNLVAGNTTQLLPSTTPRDMQLMPVYAATRSQRQPVAEASIPDNITKVVRPKAKKGKTVSFQSPRVEEIVDEEFQAGRHVTTGDSAMHDVSTEAIPTRPPQPVQGRDENMPTTLDSAGSPTTDENEEITRLWPVILAKIKSGQISSDLGLPPVSVDNGKSVPKPRHELEKIRGTTEYNVDDFDIGEIFKGAEVRLSILQLLQIAPSIRSRVSQLMQCKSRARTRKANQSVNNQVGKVVRTLPPETWASSEILTCSYVDGRQIVYRDVCGSEEAVPTTLGYVEGYVDGLNCKSILLDGGSSVNLVTRAFVDKGKFLTAKFGKHQNRLLAMANGNVEAMDEVAILNVVVGSIHSTVQALIMTGSSPWDLLVGRPWLRRMKAVEDYSAETLTVTGAKGISQTLPIYPCPNLFEPIPVKGPLHRCRATEDDDEDNVEYVENDEAILEELEESVGELGNCVRDALRDALSSASGKD